MKNSTESVESSSFIFIPSIRLHLDSDAGPSQFTSVARRVLCALLAPVASQTPGFQQFLARASRKLPTSSAYHHHPVHRPRPSPIAHWSSSESGDFCSLLCDAAVSRSPLKHPRPPAQTKPATDALTHAPTAASSLLSPSAFPRRPPHTFAATVAHARIAS